MARSEGTRPPARCGVGEHDAVMVEVGLPRGVDVAVAEVLEGGVSQSERWRAGGRVDCYGRVGRYCRPEPRVSDPSCWQAACPVQAEIPLASEIDRIISGVG